jgi:hypothetical protein
MIRSRGPVEPANAFYGPRRRPWKRRKGPPCRSIIYDGGRTAAIIACVAQFVAAAEMN